MNRSRFSFIALAVAATALPAHAQADRWWADVKALAHDSMRGRNTGSPEHRKAAEYVAATFRAAGLEPAGSNGFLQSVPFLVRSLDESFAHLALVRDGKEQELVLGEDAQFVLRAPLAPRVEADVVFVGYGLHLPEYGVDDLAGLDLHGKVVAYLTGAPKGIPGPVISHSRSQAWPSFRAAGAVAMITFSATRGGDTAFVRAGRNRLAPQMALAEPALDVQDGNQLSLQFNAGRAERLLFAGAPERFATLAARADSGLPLPRFPLSVRIRAMARLDEQPIESHNVVGIVRGGDPRLRDEYVVLTAHLDHIGVGRAVNGDSINNGAMDNASGTALLMEAARQLGASRGQLRRSVILCAVTGEEKGLLGSRWYANHPTVPAASIVADLNTDMFLPIIPFGQMMVNGLEESNLADDARRAGAALGFEVITDPEPEENRFVRSDQYSFILRGVPALSFKVGFARDTPEHKAVLEFRTKRYHQPSDDVAQPVNLEAAAGFTQAYLAIVKEVANRETRPAWNAESYFRRFAQGASAGAGRPTLTPAVRQFVRVDTSVVALTHVRVIDGTGASPRENQTLVIRNGSIDWIGDDGRMAFTPGVQVLDLTGKTVIPGLVMVHEHLYYPTGPGVYANLAESFTRLYLAGGVTTMRTGGNMNGYGELAIARAIARGEKPGPWIDATAPYLEGPGLSIGQVYALKDAADARRLVNFWADAGATSFKAYMHITREELGAAIEEAHKRGMKLTGHLCSVTYREAAQLGIDNLEHGFMAATDFIAGKKPDECPGQREGQTALATVDPNGEAVRSLIAELVRRQVALTSTLTVFETLTPGRPMPPGLDVLAPPLREQFEQRHAATARNTQSLYPTLFAKDMALERAFARAGGLLIAGTDPTGGGGVIPGFSNQRALELLVEAGFTPLEAIRVGTLNGATYLGRADRVGSIAVGKQADLVVLSGDPSVRIADVRNVELVFRQGVGWDPVKLIASVKGRVGLF